LLDFSYVLPISSNIFQYASRTLEGVAKRATRAAKKKFDDRIARKNNDCFQKENKLSNTIPPAPRNLATVK
jgi:hypothetical protein